MTLLEYDESAFDTALKEAFDETDSNFFYANHDLILHYTDFSAPFPSVEPSDAPENTTTFDTFNFPAFEVPPTTERSKTTDLCPVFTPDCIKYRRKSTSSARSFFVKIGMCRRAWYFDHCMLFTDRDGRLCIVYAGTRGGVFLGAMQKYGDKVAIELYRLSHPIAPIANSALSKFVQPIKGPIVVILRFPK